MSPYQLAPSPPKDVVANLRQYPPLLQKLLYNRKLTTAKAAKAWLAPAYEATLNDPWHLPGIKAAVTRVKAAIAKNEAVVIYADYDCDGIPGAVVLHDFFTAVGFNNFSVYLPHRHYEGFGFHQAAATKLAQEGAKLIVTIDCGTTDQAAVAAAKTAGADVIITDHHQASDQLPEATAVVNPALSTSHYPCPQLCGAGVVFKLVQALLADGSYNLAPGQEKWWLDMVGLATIADMVSLTDENRTLAHYGLKVLRKSRRPGLQALLRTQQASQAHLTEDDIGFTLGPRLNAASRMGEPLRAFKLLTATTATEAAEHARHLEQLNNERKGAVATMVRAAHKKLATRPTLEPVIVLGDPSWRPSLVGLVASKLANEHNAPVFVWGRDGNGVLRGSCRGGNAVSLIALMRQSKDSFIEYGGHHSSGGFSVTPEAIHTLSTALNQAYQTLDVAESDTPATTIEAEINLAELTPRLLREVLTLGPFGVGNPKPLLQLTNVTPQTVTVFGKAKNHTRLLLPTSPQPLEVVAFFQTPDDFAKTPSVDTSCSLLVQPEYNFFMGRGQYRLRLVEVL